MGSRGGSQRKPCCRAVVKTIDEVKLQRWLYNMQEQQLQQAGGEEAENKEEGMEEGDDPLGHPTGFRLGERRVWSTQATRRQRQQRADEGEKGGAAAGSKNQSAGEQSGEATPPPGEETAPAAATPSDAPTGRIDTSQPILEVLAGRALMQTLRRTTTWTRGAALW